MTGLPADTVALVPLSAHADGRPGFWSLVRHHDLLIVTSVWSDFTRGGQDSPPMRLVQEQADGTRTELRRTGRSGGSANGHTLAHYVYEAPEQDGAAYTFLT